jgi:hypothetical protein
MLQSQQGGAIHPRQLGWFHLTTQVRIKHPLRNLQGGKSLELIAYALQNSSPASACLATNQHSLSMPGMPAVGYLSKSSFMGVLYLGCTTRYGRIRRWAIGHRHRKPSYPNNRGMGMWKTLRVSHIPTPPATTTDKCQKRRYTNNPLGTKDPSGHTEQRPFGIHFRLSVEGNRLHARTLVHFVVCSSINTTTGGKTGAGLRRALWLLRSTCGWRRS